MKIVHVCLNRNGGAAAAAWRLHLALLDSGVDSWFFTLEPRGKSDESKKWVCWNELDKNPLQRASGFLIRNVRKWWAFKRLKQLENLERHYLAISPSINAEISSLPVAEKDILNQPVFEGAAIIHLHWVTLLINYPDFFSRCKNRFKLVWTFHDLNPVSGIFNYRFDLDQNPQAKNIDSAVTAIKNNCMSDYGKPVDAIAPCKWMAESIETSVFSSRFSVTEIPYCYESDNSASNTKKDARSALELPEESFIILSVAENSRSGRKNVAQLYRLAKAFPEILFLIVGHYESPEEPISNLIAPGFISTKAVMLDYFAAADAVLMTSVEDNLPNVMLEAFAAGRPVISYPAGGMKEYVLAEITGVQAKDMQQLSLQQAVSDFLESRDHYQSETIKAFSKQHFNNQKIAGAHISLYSRILNQ